MKKVLLAGLFLLSTVAAFAQTTDNTFTVTVNGKEMTAKAQRLNFPYTGLKYLALAGMNVNPDVQVWVRLLYTGELKPGTYQVTSQNDMDRKASKSGDDVVMALVDYTEETKGLGHAFHDGESDNNGTVTITKVTENSIEGTFEAKLKGVYYKKRGLATALGSGLQGNIERKLVTAAGGGMLANGDPHDHDNTRKTDQTDEITLTNGKFRVTWGSKSK